MDIPEQVTAAQAAADQAWAAVEAYRKTVVEQRRAETPDDPGRLPWQGRTLRDWTDDEQAEYARLHAGAVAASETRRDAMAAAGIISTYDSEDAIRATTRPAADEG